MPKQEKVVGRWCLTLNNYKEDSLEKLMGIQCISYGVVGKEKSKSGTMHLQGYLEVR